MVNIEDIVVGATFRIVDKWVPGCRQNSEGKMDRYLGTICTVKNIMRDYDRWFEFKIENDQGDHYRSNGWVWNQYCIEYLEENEFPDEISISDEEFNAII